MLSSAYFNLADYAFLAGESRKAILFAKRGLQGDTTEAALRSNMALYNLMGGANSLLGNSPEAIDNFRNAKRLARLLGNKEAYTSILVNESNILSKMGNYEVALETLIAAEKEFEASGDVTSRAIVLNNMGELYREGFGKGKKSISFYRKAMQLNKEQGDRYNLGKNVHNLALAYKEIGQTDSALAYLNQCEIILKELGALSSLVKCYYNLAQTCMEQEDLKEAKAYFEKSAVLSEEIEFELGLFYANLGMAKLYTEQKKYPEAKIYLDLAARYKPEGYEKNIEDIYYLTTYNYLVGTEQLKEALALSEHFYRTRDSLQDLQNEATILELRAGYESDITQEENARLLIEKQGADAATKNEKEQKRLYLALSILAGLVLLLALYFFLQKQRSYIKQRDLSRQLKEKNEQLLLAEKRLMAESEMKTKILSVMGHDLRAPFASIAGLLTIINEDMLSLNDAKEVIGKLSIEVEHTLTSLSNILSWSRLQLNETGIWKSTFNVHALFGEIKEMVQPAANAKQIELEMHSEKEACMYADNNQIRSILNNLLNNALKFTPEGGKVVMQHRQSKTHHILCVRDTGTGISEEALYALNNKISHSSPGTLGETGTGIGLSLVRDFAHLHGGTFTFYANEPQGTVAEVHIPIDRDKGAES
jgi:signal transduction histidine kinase